MPQAISDDLCRRLLESWAAKEGTLEELARRYRVSLGFAKKLRQQLLRTGQMNRIPQRRRGPVSRVDKAAREQLLGWIREQPDRTLAELRALLWRERRIRVSQPLLSYWLPKFGVRRKKNSARAGARRGGQPTKKS